MESFSAKVRLIFIPYLIICIAVISACSLLNYLLVLQSSRIDVSEGLVHFLIPALMPWIPLLIWVRPRVKLLKLKRNAKGGSNRSTIIVFMGFTIIAAAALMQEYLVTATGKLTSLPRISVIDKHPKTKYYTLASRYIEKQNAVSATEYSVSGKGSKYLEMDLYFVCPILDGKPTDDSIAFSASSDPPAMDTTFAKDDVLIVVDGKLASKASLSKINPETVKSVDIIKGDAAVAIYGEQGRKGAVLITTKRGFNGAPDHDADTTFRAQPKAWLGIHYHRQVDNKLPDDEKTKLKEAFGVDMHQQFDDTNFNNFTYLDKIGNTSNRYGYKKVLDREDFVDPIIFEARSNSFADRNGNSLWWFLLAFGGGALLWLIVLNFSPLDEPVIKRPYDDFGSSPFERS